MHRAETGSPELFKKRASLGSSSNVASSRSMKTPLHELNGVVSSTNSSSSFSASSNSSSAGGSFRGVPFRRFSGCYECRMVVDPVLGFTRDPSLRATICSCPDCGEIFMKAENLELHQAVRHAGINFTNCSVPEEKAFAFNFYFSLTVQCAMFFIFLVSSMHKPLISFSHLIVPISQSLSSVFLKSTVSELGPEDTSKNIVEIIFQSSWLKKQAPICKIDRILKVHNTQKTITKFEEYRDSIKSKATKLQKKHPRCIADGNELLRFHCTNFVCSLGVNGSSNLCNSIPQCNVCSIIKNGFKVGAESGGVGTELEKGILTTATSGKAHDKAGDSESNNDKRAMLVCRVIAGRVKKNMEGSMEEYDSLAGAVGVYSNLDELYVFNPRAILPCFVVIYTGF